MCQNTTLSIFFLLSNVRQISVNIFMDIFINPEQTTVKPLKQFLKQNKVQLQ